MPWRRLHLAARDGILEDVKTFISLGDNVNQVQDRRTPLQLATNNGFLEIIKELFLHGADLNFKDDIGVTALHLAARIHGRHETVALLIRLGAQVNVFNGSGNTPLHDAAYNSIVESVTELITHDAQLNVRNDAGDTPLHKATNGPPHELEENEKKVAKLIKSGADVNIKNNQGEIALHTAVKYNHANIIPLLIGAGSDLQAVDVNGHTPLYLMREKGQFDFYFQQALIPPNLEGFIEDA